MTTSLLLGNLSLKPSVKVSVEPSVMVKAMGSFGNVRSSKKLLHLLVKNHIFMPES
jgi:hypothetical protein